MTEREKAAFFLGGFTMLYGFDITAEKIALPCDAIGVDPNIVIELLPHGKALVDAGAVAEEARDALKN